MTGLADCNNFFVSCERSIDPTLIGKPVVVLSNNDGCVVARSNEAKRLGIKMGQPAFQIKDMIASGQLIALSGNHLLYRDISLRIHEIFRRYVPSTLDYSVDEAFLDMNGVPTEALTLIGEEICEVCLKEERIPITIGFAPTKTLAKVATEIGKKRGERVVMLIEEREIEESLEHLPIQELWGCGRRLTKRLYLEGVYTIGDFARRPSSWVRQLIGINGERSWRELHGQSCIMLEHIERPMQDSISETRTFASDTDDFDYLRSRIAIYSDHVARRLRQMGGICSEVSVFLRTNRFRTDIPYSTPGASARFEQPTDDTSIIATAATQLLAEIFDPHLSYKRAGVILSSITPRKALTRSLFESREESEWREKSRRLMNAIDKVNLGGKSGILKLATEIIKGEEGHNTGYSTSFGPPKK